MKTIKSYLPIFTGFYNTLFDSECAEENVMYNIVEEDGLDVMYNDVVWDYKDYQNRVANACISSVWNFLKLDGFSIDIEFERVYSPRYYNYENDAIYCTYKVSPEDFTALLDYAYKSEPVLFSEYLYERFSSRAGFISFFDVDSKVWLDEYLKEDSDKFEKAFATLLDFYLTNEGYDKENMLDDVVDETGNIDYNLKED